MSNYALWLRRPRTDIKTFKDVNAKKVKAIFAKIRKEKRSFLPEPEAYEVLKAYGFPVLGFRLAKSEQECSIYAEEIGYPVVLKIVSPDVLHKIDVGGVKVNIKNEKDLKKAYKDIVSSLKSSKPKANIWGILVPGRGV